MQIIPIWDLREYSQTLSIFVLWPVPPTRIQYSQAARTMGRSAKVAKKVTCLSAVMREFVVAYLLGFHSTKRAHYCRAHNIRVNLWQHQLHRSKRRKQIWSQKRLNEKKGMVLFLVALTTLNSWWVPDERLAKRLKNYQRMMHSLITLQHESFFTSGE